MRDFCEEVTILRASGLKVGSEENIKKFNVRLFTCDSPARSFVSGVQYFNGRSGCPKCNQKGKYVQRRMTFSKKTGERRTDESFTLRADMSHHSSEFKEHKSLLEKADFNMVSQFPLTACT